MQPHAGIPIFGLVAGSGVAVLAFVVWLVFLDRDGISSFTGRLGIGGFVGMGVLLLIAFALLAFGILKIRRLVRDLGQMLLVFDHGLAHVRPDATSVYVLSEIGGIRHQCVQLEYGGMSTGAEHAYTVIHNDGRELILLRRSYGAAKNRTDDEPLADVEQVGEFLERQAHIGSGARKNRKRCFTCGLAIGITLAYFRIPLTISSARGDAS